MEIFVRMAIIIIIAFVVTAYCVVRHFKKELAKEVCKMARCDGMIWILTDEIDFHLWTMMKNCSRRNKTIIAIKALLHPIPYNKCELSIQKEKHHPLFLVIMKMVRIWAKYEWCILWPRISEGACNANPEDRRRWIELQRVRYDLAIAGEPEFETTPEENQCADARENV